MKTIKFCFLLAALIHFLSGQAQNEAINNYLENTKQLSVKYIGDNNLSQLSNATIYQADLSFDLENSGYGSIINSAWFIKTQTELKSFRQMEELLGSTLFINSLGNFSLQNNEDALLMQTILLLFDNESFNEGYFQKENQWFFVRSKFFERAELIVVTTNESGKITSIEFRHEDNMPAFEGIAAGEKLPSERIVMKLQQNDSLEMLNHLAAEVDYHFTIKESLYTELKAISAADFYLIELSISQKQQDESYTSTMESILMDYQNQYFTTSSIENLLSSTLFFESINPDFVLANESDAAQFEAILDVLLPLSTDQQNLKSHTKIADDIWAFTRTESFDQMHGWMVLLNDKKQIKALSNGEISETAIMRMRMQDPDYKVDYGFKLINPAETNLNLKESQGLNIEIEFSEIPVNASGAWIMTRFDGKKAGIMASSQMTSPFYDEVPPEPFTKGKHILEYLLLMPGEDTDNTLGHIVLTINVK